MKKLLFLFTTLLLISCSSNSSEKKDEIQVDETFGDYWVSNGLIIYNKEGVIDLINGGLFQIIDADNVKWGEIDYDSRSKNSDSKLFKLYEVVEDEWDLTNMELKWEYKENVNITEKIKISDFNNIEFIVTSIDSLETKLKSSSYSTFGDKISVGEKSEYIRIPHFFPKDPKEFLIEKKLDLELELINQQQYDSIKNRVQKYMDSPLYN
jgi:hypothetical protein